MKKILAILVLIILLIAVGITVFLMSPSKITLADFPKDVPIVQGNIVSAKAYRSDDLTRGIKIVIETNLSLKEVADYYSSEFLKRDFRVLTLPAFAGNAKDLESSTEADAIAETKSQQGIVVHIKSEQQLTLVTIEVKGNSILYLPR